MYIKVLYNIKNNQNNKKGGGGGRECGCRGLDLTISVGEKDNKEEKKWRKKIVFGAGFEPETLRLQILHLTC